MKIYPLTYLAGICIILHNLIKTNYEVHIFAEITDAPFLTIPQILEKANALRDDGAEVIDLGCMPNHPFPHLTECIKELKKENFYLSVDSHNKEEIITASQAGVDYILSLKKDNFDIIDDIKSIPILIPNSSDDIESLYWCIEECKKRNRNFIADPILDPINHGFMNSLIRYHSLRHRYPEIHIMMGIGNITELTHADTTGITAILLGIISEIIDINKKLGCSIPEGADYHTLAGFMLEKFQMVPKIGDVLDFNNIKFEVISMSGPKIDRVKIILSKS